MMNNPGVLQPEKMDLDLEIPSSLVQTDGHLRRSNSAPMINGLRLNNQAISSTFLATDNRIVAMGLTSGLIISVTTPWSSREKFYAAGETAQQS